MNSSERQARWGLGFVRHCFLAVLLACSHLAAADEGDLADLLLFNGNIITVDDQFSVAEAIAIKGDRIMAVGRHDELQRHIGTGTLQVDLEGRTVTPGFIDGHAHLFGMNDVPLTGVRSVQDILDVVTAEAARSEPGEWLIFEPPGEPPYYFHMPDRLKEKRFPTRAELDAAAPHNPVFIKSSDFHERPTSLFNSLALERLGITRDSGPIEYVEVGREQDGTPTGEVFGNLSYFSPSPLKYRLWSLARKYTLDEQVEELRRDMAEYNAGGVTAIYEGHGMPDDTIEVYRELHERGGLTVRSYLLKTIDTPAPVEAIEEQIAGMQEFAGLGLGDDMFRVAGVAVVMGDNVGFGAGLMHEPYTGLYGEEWTGLQLLEDEKLEAIARAAARHDIRLNVQASGSLAIEKVLAAFDAVNRDIPITEKRFVIEHCQFPSEQAMKDAARLGVVPTTVTNFLWGQGNSYIRFYGRERANQAVPLRSWLEHGVPVVQSTDYGPNDAMFTLWQSIARKNGWTGETLGETESISREDAIRIYTINGARLAFGEDKIGSLEAGKLADLVILDRDILTVPLDEIRETRVLATMVGGKLVHGSLESL